jgi:hypothetical protein
MKYNINHPRLTPGSTIGLWRFLVAVLTLMTLSVAGVAQETTSSVRGTVTGPGGTAVSGAAVVLIDTRTSTTRTATTSDSGTFSISGLRIGGPYEAQITSPTYANQKVTDIYVALGDTHTFTVALSDNQIEEIVVTAQQIGSIQVAIGPSTTFTLADLRDAPAINRDITDVVKIDSRIYVDEAGNRGDAIHCGGAHNRFNSLTIDGVRMNDQFGLNSNGYPTARTPFSYDAIQQVAVEMAPFDVQYGGFTACNINAVTKSGTNEFSGSAFYDYTDDSMKGDSLNGNPIDLGSFEEKRYGFSLGGPILRDKLFFFGAYEKLEGADIFQRGPSDSPNAATKVQGVTQAQLDRITQVSKDVYGYDPGPVISSLPVEDEKLLLRLDYNINDSHRVAYTYMWNDGFNIAESDGDADEFEFSRHYYERGAEMKSHALQWQANWNDKFSTEVRYSRIELDNRQINIGDPDFGEVQIRTYNNGARTTVYLGADDSRHANKLAWDQDSYKFSGTYNLGDHAITAGFERDELSVFNMFVQEAQGEFEFERACSASNPDACIDQFEAGQPDDVTYENHPSHNPQNAGQNWGYEINTLYLQDEFPLADGDVTVVAGLRYDYYTSSDVPIHNPNFEARNGYTNSMNFDGVNLLQPRLGIHWQASEKINVHGGIGLYSGGNPNVWLSNNYSNDGITQVEDKGSYFGGTETLLPGNPNGLTSVPSNGDGRPLWNIPQPQVDGVSSGSSNGGVNAMNPSFKVPSAWKFALGMTWDVNLGFLGDDYVFGADYMYSRMSDAAIIVDSTLVEVGKAPDGRPIYHNIDKSDPDCSVPLSSACGSRAFRSDYILSNTIGGDNEQQSFSLSLSKAHDFGLDWTLGYTYNKSKDVSPMTSFVAFTNYVSLATSDPNNPGDAKSNYQVPNRFALRMNYRHAFWGNNQTKFTLFASRNQGRPFSYTFDDEGFVFGDTLDGRHLLYVPTGPADPNVEFAAGFDQAAFFAFINANGLSEYAGGIAPRNEFDSDWWTKVDIRIEQEFPGFGEGHNFAAFLMVENLGNLIDDSWGVQDDAGFTRIHRIVEMESINANNQYVFGAFNEVPVQTVQANSSLWQVRFGVRYDF